MIEKDETSFLVRNIPRHIWVDMKGVARVQGISLNALVLNLIENEAKKSELERSEEQLAKAKREYARCVDNEKKELPDSSLISEPLLAWNNMKNANV